MKKHSPAILFMAYGSPDTPADIEAYYTDIRRGRPPEPAQLKELEDRYAAIGGRTPLLQITQDQAKALSERLGLEVYIGMKHWRPYIPDAVRQIARAGHDKVLALVLAPHYSTMSVADYKARLEHAVAEAEVSLAVEVIERWGDNPSFITSICDRLEATRPDFPMPRWDDIEVVFTAHSLPTRILKDSDPYLDELQQTAQLAATRLGLPHWRLAFQSAGRTADTWLGPDVMEELRGLAGGQRRQVLVAPIGFVTDNLEILYDLDIEAAQLAKQLGLTFRRIPTANATPLFIDALCSVIAARIPALAHPES